VIPVARKVLAADCLGDAGSRSAPADHSPGIGLGHRIGRQHFAVVTPRSAEQPSLAILDNAGRVDVGAQGLGERVMARHRMLFAAFLVQADRPPGAAWAEVLDLHLQGRVDPREAVGEGSDQCPVAQVAQGRRRDRGQQFAPFGAFEHRRLAGLDHVLGPAHRMRRVCRHDLAGHQPVKQHPYCRELLLDRRRRDRVLQLLYIGGDVMWADTGRHEAAILAPGKEPVAGPGVSAARVRVADVGREEFDIAPGRLVAEIGDQGRHHVQRALIGGDVSLLDRRRKLLLGLVQNGPPTLIFQARGRAVI
jgi:hypothetical protein